jgi:hypothetical protein
VVHGKDWSEQRGSKKGRSAAFQDLKLGKRLERQRAHTYAFRACLETVVRSSPTSFSIYQKEREKEGQKRRGF